MPGPLVSILMPLYNTAAYVDDAIASIRRETYAHFELLICDDASTDGSRAIAECHAREDPRIRLFPRDTNSGNVAVIYRFLADQARGDFLIASDSDDIALPTRLQTLVALAQRRPDASLVYGIVHAVSPDLQQVLRVCAEPYCPFQMFASNIITDGGSLIRRTAYDAAGGYDATQSWAEDYELRLRLALEGPMVHVGELVYLYRWHGRSWSARHRDVAREHAFKQRLLARESASLARIRRGEIASYRDAVVAAYSLAGAHVAQLHAVRSPLTVLVVRFLERARLDRSHRLRNAGRRTLQTLRHLRGKVGRRLARHRLRVSRATIADALHSAGLAPGDTAMVHSSLSALGWIDGGASTVVDCLQHAVGPAGRLLMPTFTYACDLGARPPAAPPKPAQRFHPDLPSSPEMGAVAECFRRRPGVHRIVHPGLSLATWGAGAADFAQPQRLFDSFSLDSPMRLVHEQGKVVMLGTDLVTVTALHLAEYLAGVPYAAYRHYFGLADAPGGVVHLRTTGASGAFAKLANLLQLEFAQAKVVPLGRSQLTVFPARPIIDFAAQMLRHLPDFFLGSESPSCRERRQFIPVDRPPRDYMAPA